VLQCVAVYLKSVNTMAMEPTLSNLCALQCVAVCCSVLHCVAKISSTIFVYCKFNIELPFESICICLCIFVCMLVCVCVCVGMSADSAAATWLRASAATNCANSCSVMQRAAVCCSALQCVAVCLKFVNTMSKIHKYNDDRADSFEFPCVTVCCSVSQCVAVRCSVYQIRKYNDDRAHSFESLQPCIG